MPIAIALPSFPTLRIVLSSPMNNRKPAANPTAKIDLNVADDLRVLSQIGVYEDLSPIVAFVEKDGLHKAFGHVLHYSSTAELTPLTQAAKRLARILEVTNYILHEIAEDSPNLAVKLAMWEQHDRLKEFYAEMCDNLRFVYKIYGQRKPQAVNLVTSLLTCIIEFKNSSTLSHFFDLFDFNNVAVHKILVPNKDDFERKIVEEESMRTPFAAFWILLCSAANPTLRKTAMTNYKMIGNFWRYMEMDRYEMLIKIFEFVDEFVLEEPAFKKATKCRILNENFLYNARLLFAYVKAENDRRDDSDDVNEFKTFKTTFVEIMNKLVTDKAKGISYPPNEHGLVLEVNGIEFKVNNKLIYTLLTALKPWDSFVQLQYAMQILNNNHELLPPYMNHIVANSGGYHDPALSSYWIGHTLLYTEILKSKDLPVPSSEFVSLAPLSRTAMSNCLAFPNKLVKQLTLQLMLLQLQKVALTSSQRIIEGVFSEMPPHSAYIELLVHENKLIRLTATLVAALAEQIAPKSSSSALVSSVGVELSKLNDNVTNCSASDLILLDKYLSIQSNNELKWWNKTPEGNCFFTSLLKLSVVRPLHSKILKILLKLTSSTLVFNETATIESPISALIQATAEIVEKSSAHKLWSCIDEVISRAVKTPYKYLDQSHAHHGDVSIFLIVLFEQLKYITDLAKEADILTWLEQLLTKCIVLGESADGIQALIQSENIPISLDSKSQVAPEIINSKYALALAVRALNGEIKSSLSSETAVYDICTRIGNYLISCEFFDKRLTKFLSSLKTWPFIVGMLSSNSSKKSFQGITYLSKILSQLFVDFAGSELQMWCFESMRNPDVSEYLAQEFLWILSDLQLIDVATLDINEHLSVDATNAARERQLNFKPSFARLMKLEPNEVAHILQEFEPSLEEANLILKNPKFHFLLEKVSSNVEEVLLQAEIISDDILYRVAPVYPNVASKYQARTVDLALSMKSITYTLGIFAKNANLFNHDELLDALMENERISFKLSMTSAFTTIVEVLSPLLETLDRVKTWFHKAMLYVTRKFAESEHLSKSFNAFLESLRVLILRQPRFLNLVPISVLDAQLEVLLLHKSWVQNEPYLEYANVLVLANKSKPLSAEKLLQLFIANERIPLFSFPSESNFSIRFQAALLIHSLHFSKKNFGASEGIMEQILILYLGSTRPDDLLLKDVLVSLELKVSSSWVDKVGSWEYLEEMSQSETEVVGEDRLISRERNSLSLTLHRSFVKNTCDHILSALHIPQTKSYDEFLRFSHESVMDKSYQSTIYDPEFLLMTIINNLELAFEKESRLQLDIMKLIDSDLMHFIVCCLANLKVRGMAKVVLSGILRTLIVSENGHVDQVFKIYCASLLHTMREADHHVPMVWYMVGSFASILASPGHFLFDTIYQYILTTPVFKENTIPLYRQMIMTTKAEDLSEEDDFYKQLTWFVNKIAHGTQSSEDVSLLKSRRAIETFFNTCNSQIAPSSLITACLKLIHLVQNVDGDGAHMLVANFAGLSALELVKDSRNKTFTGEQRSLNVDQLALRFGIAGRAQKRTREWGQGCFDAAVKRIHSV